MQNTPSSLDAANRTPVLSFLTSLNTSLGGGADLSGLFASLLDAAQDMPPASNATGAANPVGMTLSTTVVTNAPKAACDAIGDIMQQLRQFSAKWSSYQNNGRSDQNQQPCKTQT